MSASGWWLRMLPALYETTTSYFVYCQTVTCTLCMRSGISIVVAGHAFPSAFEISRRLPRFSSPVTFTRRVMTEVVRKSCEDFDRGARLVAEALTQQSNLRALQLVVHRRNDEDRHNLNLRLGEAERRLAGALAHAEEARRDASLAVHATKETRRSLRAATEAHASSAAAFTAHTAKVESARDAAKEEVKKRDAEIQKVRDTCEKLKALVAEGAARHTVTTQKNVEKDARVEEVLATQRERIALAEKRAQIAAVDARASELATGLALAKTTAAERVAADALELARESAARYTLSTVEVESHKATCVEVREHAAVAAHASAEALRAALAATAHAERRAAAAETELGTLRRR